MTGLTLTFTLARHIASLINARKNCEKNGNTEWFHRHTEALEYLQNNFLPSGGGFDNGSTIDLDASTDEKIVIDTSFHHMMNDGYYYGWTDHTVTVRPSFMGLNITVSGRNRNDIKDYIADAFDTALKQRVTHTADGFTRAEEAA